MIARPVLLLIGAAMLSGCAVREIAATNYAKELCSCMFVVEQTENYCLAYVRHDLQVLDDLPIIDTDDDAVIDRRERTVTVDLLLTRATARYQSDRLGCVLEP